MNSLRFSDYCAFCRKGLALLPQIYFVEKEIQRCFCSEDCIQDYFQPHVEFLSQTFNQKRKPSDFSEHERFSKNSYQFKALMKPSEIWVEELESGELWYTSVTYFSSNPRNPQTKKWAFIVVYLMLEGQPSFIFQAFATRDEDLIEVYRNFLNPNTQSKVKIFPKSVKKDISRENFEHFEAFVEPTIEEPDEIWSFVSQEDPTPKEPWIAFIKKYEVPSELQSLKIVPSQAPYFYMIVVCRSSCEVLFAIPTLDVELVQSFRIGMQKSIQKGAAAA